MPRLIKADNGTKDLLRVFGDEYRRYTARVHRIIPFVKPGGSSV